MKIPLVGVTGDSIAIGARDSDSMAGIPITGVTRGGVVVTRSSEVDTYCAAPLTGIACNCVIARTIELYTICVPDAGITNDGVITTCITEAYTIVVTRTGVTGDGVAVAFVEAYTICVPLTDVALNSVEIGVFYKHAIVSMSSRINLLDGGVIRVLKEDATITDNTRAAIYLKVGNDYSNLFSPSATNSTKEV